MAILGETLCSSHSTFSNTHSLGYMLMSANYTAFLEFRAQASKHQLDICTWMFHRCFQLVPPPFSISTNDMPSTKTQHKGHPYLLPLFIIALHIQTSTKFCRLYFLNISGIFLHLPISKVMLSPPTFLAWISATISSWPSFLQFCPFAIHCCKSFEATEQVVWSTGSEVKPGFES